MFRRSLAAALLAVILAAVSGCGAIGEFLLNSLLGGSRDEDQNEFWREGGGFNNPNVERIREGKEPKDF